MNEKAPSWLEKLRDLRRAIQAKERAVTKAAKKKSPHPSPEPVVNGIVKWKPIDRTAAIVVAPANWIHKPNAFRSAQQAPLKDEPKPNKSRKRKRNHEMKEVQQIPASQHETPRQWTTTTGIRIQMDNGEPMLNLDDVRAFLCEEITKLPKETRPNVKAAEDARRIIGELTEGIGGDMEKFRADTKRYLEDIRSTRFAVVSETSQMVTSLKEVRQFFLGGDYKEEISRLRDFVDLCERLEGLKQRGTLDALADTMLKLAIEPSST